MTYQPPLNGKRISIKADDNSAIESGEVTLASGSNVTLDQSGNTITFDSSAPPVLVLGEDDPIPEGTSPDTIIVRLGEGVGEGEGGEGGLSAIFNVSTKTSNYTITTDDTMVLADATSDNVTITLPLASEAEGYRFYIKRIDDSGNTVTIARSGSDTIDGGTSASINGQWTVVGAVSDGNAWYLI